MMIVTAGSQDVTTYFHLRLAADGTDATGLTITNIDLQYVRSGAAPSTKADATALAAADSAHGDNQAFEIDATDQPGVYRVDWPDAAFTAGVREVILTVKCATVFTESLRVQIVSATRGLSGTALPDAAAEASGGLYTRGTGAGQINQAANGQVDANTVAINASATAADNQERAALALYRGSVTGAATTTTLIDSGLTQADTDHWKGRIVIFTTGSLAKQATDITAFDPALDKLTFTALTNAPSGADEYVIV